MYLLSDEKTEKWLSELEDTVSYLLCDEFLDIRYAVNWGDVPRFLHTTRLMLNRARNYGEKDVVALCQRKLDEFKETLH